MEETKLPDISSEFEFATSRSSGPGGQNVNKLETKVELRWNLNNTNQFDEKQKLRILTKCASYITNDGVFIVTDQSSRSQGKNKTNCILKIQHLIKNALEEEKERIKTKVPKEIKEQRLQQKQRQSFIKSMRKVSSSHKNQD